MILRGEYKIWYKVICTLWYTNLICTLKEENFDRFVYNSVLFTITLAT